MLCLYNNNINGYIMCLCIHCKFFAQLHIHVNVGVTFAIIISVYICIKKVRESFLNCTKCFWLNKETDKWG